MSDTDKAVIYARYSSAGQRDESIEGQLRECHVFAERYGISVIGEYCDRALSGTTDKRPEFQRMIKDSAKGNFNIVIVWKNDRFARSRYDSAVYKYKLKQNGVRLLYAKESIPDGPEGIILESVMEGFAEYYSANLSQNIKRGNYESALKRQTVGVRLFGLRENENKQYEPDPKTAPIVRRIFDEYVAGKPVKEIIDKLNAEGYKTVRNAKFSNNSLYKLLRNEKYIGVYHFLDIRDEEAIEPIVDKDTFNKAQEMMNQRKKAPAQKRTDGGFLLTTKLFCGMCGEAMTGDSGTGKRGKVYNYYTCNNRRKHKCTKERANKEWIEDVIVNALSDIINSDEMINEIADRFMQWQDEQNKSEIIVNLEKELQRIEKATENNLNLIDSGIITESIKSHIIELESQRIDIEKQIAKTKLEVPKISRKSIIWFLERFRNGDKEDYAWRIFLIDTFLESAYLYDDGRLILHLNYCGENKKVTVSTAESATNNGSLLGSSLVDSAPPKCANLNTAVYFFKGLLFAEICTK